MYLFASLVDQLLLEYEGFQMLQPVSTENSYSLIDRQISCPTILLSPVQQIIIRKLFHYDRFGGGLPECSHCFP